MLRIVSCVFIAMATLCVSNFAYAQEDYSRAGCYLGLGAAAALSLSADDTLEDESERVFGPVRFFRPDLSADVEHPLNELAGGVALAAAAAPEKREGFGDRFLGE